MQEKALIRPKKILFFSQQRVYSLTSNAKPGPKTFFMIAPSEEDQSTSN